MICKINGHVHTAVTGGRQRSLQALILSLSMSAFFLSQILETLNCRSKLLSRMLNSTPFQHTQYNTFTDQCTYFVLWTCWWHLPADINFLCCYWPNSKFVTVMKYERYNISTVDYTRYTRIMYRRPCCNVYIVSAVIWSAYCYCFLFMSCTQVLFDSVGGLSRHIRALKEMIVFPLLYPEIFIRFKIAPPRGVLFHGPPGMIVVYFV